MRELLSELVGGEHAPAQTVSVASTRSPAHVHSGKGLTSQSKEPTSQNKGADPVCAAMQHPMTHGQGQQHPMRHVGPAASEAPAAEALLLLVVFQEGTGATAGATAVPRNQEPSRPDLA